MPLPVALAVMTAGDVRMECVEGIASCIADQTIAQFWITQSGPYLDNGRNNVVKTFDDHRVREKCTHLLMVDSDIGFTPQDVADLYEASSDDDGYGRAVVSGVYYSSFSGVAQPIIYDWGKNSEGTKLLEVIDHWDDDWSFWNQKPNREDIEPIVRVEAAGAGFLMVRYEVLDVLEALHGDPQPWFCEPTVDGIHYGEDLAFCMRVKDAGFSVWAHREVELAHYKSTMIGPGPGSRVVA